MSKQVTIVSNGCNAYITQKTTGAESCVQTGDTCDGWVRSRDPELITSKAMTRLMWIGSDRAKLMRGNGTGYSCLRQAHSFQFNSVQFHSAALYSSCEGQFHNDRLMNRRINSKEKQLAEGRNTDKKLTILLMCNYKVLL